MTIAVDSDALGDRRHVVGCEVERSVAAESRQREEGSDMDIDTVTDPEAVGMSAARLERIATAMQDYVDRGVVRGISTLVARRGHVVHRSLHGDRDAEAGMSMADDTIFRIYSMTKPIVSTTLMLLHEEGSFQLEQPLATFLPAFAAPKVLQPDGSLVDAARPITIGDALAHTSGLTYDFMIDNPAAELYREHQVMHDATRTLAEVVDLIATLPLGFQPGERWHYSVGIDVAARLVEVIADQPLGEFLQERIFTPLGMVDTGFGVPDDRLDRLSAMYGLPDLVGDGYHAGHLFEAALAGFNERIDVSDTYPTSTPDVYVRGGVGLYSGGNPNVWLSNNYSNDGVTQVEVQDRSLDDGGDREMAKYMQAAVLYLQQDKAWLLPEELRIEAETLEPLAHSGGNVRPQGIKGWSGGSQIWWTDGKVDDSLELELETPVAGRFELVANFTMARDYGIVQLDLNGQSLGEPRDLYSENVSRSGDISLGDFDLPAGKQNFKLTITGKNDKAVDGWMAGVDYFILRGKTETGSDMVATERLESVAEEHEVDAAQLQHWIDAVIDPATKNMNHPLWLLRQMAQLTGDLHADETEQTLRPLIEKILHAEHEASKFFGGATTLMTDPREWFAQGHAFYDGGGFGVDATDAENPVTWPAPHSGRNGNRYQGVLRSPTFEIKHSMIHYRVKARNAKIRLIIDGFTLDEYNALLFGGMKMEVDTEGRWQWVTQAGDLKNHIGQRAYIEIIDEGDGFIAVRQVEASNDPVPREYSRNIGMWILPGTDRWDRATTRDSLTPLELATERLARGTWQLMRTGFGYDPHELVNFFVRHQLIPGADYEAIDNIIEETQKELADVNDQVPAPVLAIGMVDGSPENEYVFIRGNHKNLGDEAPRGPLKALVDSSHWDYDLPSSGRMELAQHMVSPHQPLTRRVIVNRVWHHLLGRGLVASVDNLGVLGSPPSHPELLDHLANQLSDSGWSIKKLIRDIVLSQTYRMSSQTSDTAADIDPDNQLLHRARVRRLQGEAIRDSMLAISGELDTTMYGPGVPIHLTPFMQGRGRPGKSGPLDGNGRRSIYIEVRRNFLSPMMLAFDTPIPFNAIGRRNQSNVPAQALILLNDPFVIDQASKWASRLIEEYPDADERLVNAFKSAIGRRPSEVETRELQDFMTTQAADLEIEDYRDDPQVWSDLCHVLFNLKEFIYIE